jgi:hypothetical protein
VLYRILPGLLYGQGPTPSADAPFASTTSGKPASRQASKNACGIAVHRSRSSRSTGMGPSLPWKSPAKSVSRSIRR